MWRHALRNFGKVAAGLAAATLVCELVLQAIVWTPLRWVLPVPAVALYGPDAVTGYRHRPNVSGMWLLEHRSFVTTSNLGLRDRNRAIPHPGAPRALVIGDSIIEAVQVEQSETAAAVAERLVSRVYPGAEVVNLGLAGASAAVDVARLASQGLDLRPDVALVVLNATYPFAPELTNDGEFVGYVRRVPDGPFELSYGFRASKGYRFRTSAAGSVFYWLLDHSQAMRVLNDRKNLGPLAEWSQLQTPPPAAVALGPSGELSCSSGTLDALLALWAQAKPPDRRALADAVLRDLAAIGRANQVPIIVLMREIEARCPTLDGKRQALLDAMRPIFEAHGLRFVDLDARVVAKVGRQDASRLYGFGAELGHGHLNVSGNRVYGEIFADVIATQFADSGIRK